MKKIDTVTKNDIRTNNEYLERLLISRSEKKVFIDLKDVEWIESSGNYIKLNLGQEHYLVRSSLKKLESRLDPRKFIRIHRSCIVNIKMVKMIEPWFTGDAKVVLKNGETLRLSRNYKENLAKFRIN